MASSELARLTGAAVLQPARGGRCRAPSRRRSSPPEQDSPGASQAGVVVVHRPRASRLHERPQPTYRRISGRSRISPSARSDADFAQLDADAAPDSSSKPGLACASEDPTTSSGQFYPDCARAHRSGLLRRSGLRRQPRPRRLETGRFPRSPMGIYAANRCRPG